jgi:hypothetical protein
MEDDALPVGEPEVAIVEIGDPDAVGRQWRGASTHSRWSADWRCSCQTRQVRQRTTRSQGTQ